MDRLGFVDIFAGAGGLAEGFICNHFFPIAFVEMNSDACDTLKTRLAYHYLKEKNKLHVYRDYITKRIDRKHFLDEIPNEIKNSVIHEAISEKSLRSIFKTIDKIAKKENVSVDVLVGGPPCQAYSLVGRSSKRLYDLSKDTKNYLYKLYVEFLKKYKPQIFVFENVLGILSASNGQYYQDFINLAKSVGYKVDAYVLNSEDYGVLQNRKRVLVIGHLTEFKSICLKPDPIDSSKYCVGDLLKDLPPLIEEEVCNFYKTKPSLYLSTFKIREKDDVLTWHQKRPNNMNDKTIYKTAIDLWNKKRSRLKYSDLPTELKTHKNQSAFLDRYKVVAGDLHSSQTMLAHIAKDGHYFIHPDIKQCRSLSVREAARIQSFPDSYYFEGSRCAAFTQIGNAVPPLMAKQIAKKIKEALEEQSNDAK